MCEMGKNHSSVVVLWIQPNFWWMLPMGVRDNHTSWCFGFSQNFGGCYLWV